MPPPSSIRAVVSGERLLRLIRLTKAGLPLLPLCDRHSSAAHAAASAQIDHSDAHGTPPTLPGCHLLPRRPGPRLQWPLPPPPPLPATTACSSAAFPSCKAPARNPQRRSYRLHPSAPLLYRLQPLAPLLYRLQPSAPLLQTATLSAAPTDHRRQSGDHPVPVRAPWMHEKIRPRLRDRS